MANLSLEPDCQKIYASDKTMTLAWTVSEIIAACEKLAKADAKRCSHSSDSLKVTF